MILCMSFSYVLDDSVFAVKASLNPTALFLVSLLALVVNVAVFVYHFAKVIKYKRNPITAEVHTDLGEYKELIAERDLAIGRHPDLGEYRELAAERDLAIGRHPELGEYKSLLAEGGNPSPNR
jgi:hypothetical protein